MTLLGTCVQLLVFFKRKTLDYSVIYYLSKWVDLNHGGVLVEEELVQVQENTSNLLLFSSRDTKITSNFLIENKMYIKSFFATIATKWSDASKNRPFGHFNVCL